MPPPPPHQLNPGGVLGTIYSVSPPLSNGLLLGQCTGTLSGTPTDLTKSILYTFVAQAPYDKGADPTTCPTGGGPGGPAGGCRRRLLAAPALAAAGANLVDVRSSFSFDLLFVVIVRLPRVTDYTANPGKKGRRSFLRLTLSRIRLAPRATTTTTVH